MATGFEILGLGLGLFLKRKPPRIPDSAWDPSLSSTLLNMNRTERAENDKFSKGIIQDRANRINTGIKMSNRPLAVQQALMSQVTSDKHILYTRLDRQSALQNWYQDINVLQTNQSIINTLNANSFKLEMNRRQSMNNFTQALLGTISPLAMHYL